MIRKEKYLSKPVKPDWESFVACLQAGGKSRRVHIIELFLDPEIQDAVGREFDLFGDLHSTDPFLREKKTVRVQRFLGYDYVRQGVDEIDMRFSKSTAEDTAEFSRQGGRKFVDSHRGPITNWEEFENYQWPDPARITTRSLEWYEQNLPDDMCIVGSGGFAHFAEHLTWLMGYENLCYALYDDPGLVSAITEKLYELNDIVMQHMLEFSRVKVIWGSDDMGFKTGPLISPEHLRQYVLPGHREVARMAHEAGLPYLLHCCGQVEDIMEDLIEGVKIDGKHSFEDIIMDVREFYAKYGKRISVLGGIDIDFLCRSRPEEVRSRVRETLESCFRGGGYLLGTGNSVANYVPLENYLAMLDEGRKIF